MNATTTALDTPFPDCTSIPRTSQDLPGYSIREMAAVPGTQSAEVAGVSVEESGNHVTSEVAGLK